MQAPSDPFNREYTIELTGLESMGITSPATGRIGAGIYFNEDDWFFPGAGPVEVG